jgi:hypothetical protein
MYLHQHVVADDGRVVAQPDHEKTAVVDSEMIDAAVAASEAVLFAVVRLLARDWNGIEVAHGNEVVVFAVAVVAAEDSLLEVSAVAETDTVVAVYFVQRAADYVVDNVVGGTKIVDCFVASVVRWKAMEILSR